MNSNDISQIYQKSTTTTTTRKGEKTLWGAGVEVGGQWKRCSPNSPSGQRAREFRLELGIHLISINTKDDRTAAKRMPITWQPYCKQMEVTGVDRGGKCYPPYPKLQAKG